MALTLRDVVYQVRVKLGELIPNFWNDEDIIYDVNYGLKDMCSAAQNLETAVQFLWPYQPGTTTPMQEAPLRSNVDQIIGVGIYSGQFFQLNALDASDVQIANKVQGIPTGFYTRTDTTILTPQGNVNTNTGDIQLIDLKPNMPQGQDFVTVLGMWPVPLSNVDTTVWYTQTHPFVSKPLDGIAIPDRFHRAIVAYAVARSKEKESALDEAAYYDKMYEQGKQAMVDYYISHKQLRTFPQYGGTQWPSLARGSSSIIFIDQSPTAFNA